MSSASRCKRIQATGHRVGVQNYEAEGGKLTKIAPKVLVEQQKNARAAGRR
ncbi:hypothetical protein [Steroidobacter cummioxidans]|uniref:hypothetical protein n=1 Tax=Steroidobacter cummioxidans TaxID=1803913 RepID=UPI00137A9082|nr:hypothetical protein [Steroidobacter cummioxidans]